MVQDHNVQEHNERVLNLTINGKHYHWNVQYITGAEVRKLGNITKEDDIFLTVKRPWEDELISDETKVNLARPEIEHFISKEKPVKVTIIVNAKEKSWNEKQISFEQLIVLAFGSYDNNPDKVYTVTYDKGPNENREGSMIKGDTVFVKNKMIFNVAATDKS
jgi:hypothetical protein